ncbi:VIT domain-containing protein [Candidatus Accumulibacter vicinus]|uniref:Marine proteobacterial sortase target protein n=1 Tax=Candidatus Accumulibacter vicinus TaxID=2954382 RepID=A0A084Y4Z5_9PROT|nr:VIT domain-containing protein [Candidatus Accumulibacter vicinus]KFB69789.1 MAG: marine proteobacterial sortase target protein [Candidatus Accumulibacter vicinus]
MKVVQALVLLALFCAGQVAGAQQALLISEPPPRVVRPIRLHTPEAAQPVRLTRVSIEVVVVGRLAKSTVEMTFHNPNARLLEGELQFPLLDGQEVSGFALDFDGKWRPAVPVDKARGQEVFEEVTRTRVDPALLEATQGNNYKLRIYPIPAQGDRKVSLSISEHLRGRRDGTALLRLPLAFGERLENFDLRIQVPGLKADAARVVRGLSGARWENREGGATLAWHRRNDQPQGLAEVSLSPHTGPLVTVEEYGGKRYFYAELPGPGIPPATRPKPGQLALVWDASGSGAQREHGREFALLDAYFKALGNGQVRLTLARDSAEDGGNFVIRGGDWSVLRARLEQVIYDGATNMAAFRPPAGADAVLLFSDGLGNFSAQTMPDFDLPLFAVSAAAAADGERLRQAATSSGGAFVDLLATSPAAAVTALRSIGPGLTALRSNGASELVAAPPDPESGRLAVAGILTEPTAVLDLEWRKPGGGIERQQVRVGGTNALSASFAAQAWARLRLQQLLPERSIHRTAIARLGKSFGLVTPGTSLIVLDRVEDYVRHEIPPPAELRDDYERLAASRRQQVERDRARHIEDIARRFKEKQAWWERDFPKGDRPPVRQADKVAGAAGAAPGMMMERRSQPAAAAAPVPPRPEMAAAAPASKAKLADAEAPVARIQLKKWLPDAPYAERLRKTEADQLYRVYLDERPAYLNSTAFFLDVADIFFERARPELALRILSNLAEMDLENRHILRILGYRLLQAKRADLAVPVLQRVLDLAPNEPQSWRDLGLAQAETGDRQQAVESLYQVVTRPWHNRFPDIELIALAEMNALIATAPSGIDTSAIDPRFLRNLPLDLRVLLAWDADNTDIDLWVTDPNGEKAYYGNRLTYQGGAMSRDFTGGYGPEEFSLKKAKPGRYLVQAQFYGHRQQVVAGATTLSLRLYTAFGSAAQKEEWLTLRLKGQREVVTVGEFVVGQ